MIDFQERYRSNETSWEINREDRNLVEVVARQPIKPCHALDIGCGTGNNAIWLQQQGFTVTGIDASSLAIERAENKARDAGVHCSFHVLDFFKDTVPKAPYDFIFDRGCFHHPPEPGNFKPFAENVFSNLKEGGLWLSLIGSCDETREGPGPPQVRASQVVTAVEPYFAILLLRSGYFDSDQSPPARNWICLMQRRAAVTGG